MKPLSPRRSREFRGRRLKKVFGTREQRAKRFAKLTALYGKDIAVWLSSSRPNRPLHWDCDCPLCLPSYY